MASDATSTSEVESLRKEVERLQVELKQKQAAADLTAPYSKSYNRVMISTILDAPDGGASFVNRTLRVGGWVKTGREAGAGQFAFLEVNDGSCFASLQVMITAEVAEAVGGLSKLVPTSTSVLVEGTLAETPPGTKQKVELKAARVVHVGLTNAGEYPLAKKRQSFEFLREKMHLRPRTNTIGAVARIRNALAYATHRFFQDHGFLYVHTPILTAADCEGAGEMFQVTTVLAADRAHEHVREETAEEAQMATQAASPRPAVPEPELHRLREAVATQATAVRELKASKDAPKEAVKEAVHELLRLKTELAAAEGKGAAAAPAGVNPSAPASGIPRTQGGQIDFAKDFFGRSAFLTVSGQLNAEYYACALSNVYTFGPTFRAENSHTARHLAEFWMVEPEIAYADLADVMQCAQDYVQYCCRFLLGRCSSDLEFITSMVDKTARERLELVASTPFRRVSYTEAVEILEAVVAEGEKKFEYPVSWGADLQSEHERYLTEVVFKAPIIVYDYPAAIKAFYMRRNDDGKTVAAMDLLVPKVGELLGGSQREERYDVVVERIREMGMPLEAYAGYLDLRKYGTVPHSGFGLGFERLVLFATGLDNIREVIPFPRWPGHCEY